MSDHVLVTGGAGFIGSHLVDKLIDEGAAVRVLDSIEPQVHARANGSRNPRAHYIEGTVLDPDVVSAALDGVGAVVHLAAQVGVGQSMYEIARYVRENALGTAVLLETLARRRKGVTSLIVASSMSIYGEGRYACDGCGLADAEVVRSSNAMQVRRWEPVCVRCGATPRPMTTPEWKRLQCDSVYAITKRDHEELCLVFGRAYGVRTIALRFFNVFGPRQSLSNPYTGVAAIFSTRLLNHQPPVIFEDGLQSRDFVHVSDVVQAIHLALRAGDVGNLALNVGTGIPTTILQLAQLLAVEIGVETPPLVANRFRQGDIRHCLADISAARATLGYSPRVSLLDGVRDLMDWIRDAAPHAQDLTARSTAELESLGLVV